MGDTVRTHPLSQVMKTNPSVVDANAPHIKPEAHRASHGLRPPTRAFEDTLVNTFITIIQCRPQQSLLLSDLGALMNKTLRHAIKEKGGLRTWIQRYPQHFVIRAQPGKELVALVEPRTDDKENESPQAENRRVSRSSVDNSDGAHHSNRRRGRVEHGEQLDDHKDDLGFGLDLAHDLNDEYGGVVEVQPVLQLRGLPYRAQVDDILCFLGEHVAFLKPPARNNVQIVLQRDGRPSGFARVNFLTAQSARECRDRLHMRRMNDRYVEIFLHNERHSRPKNDDQSYSVHHMPHVYEEKNSKRSDSTERDAPSEVLRECTAYLKQQGKFVLLSMLGVALSPQSREYLKRNDQGLKQFLANYPELCVEGKKGCEWVGFTCDSGATAYQSEKSAKRIPTAAPLPVVSALALHRAPPQLQQEQEQLVQPRARGSRASPQVQQKHMQQAELHVSGSRVSATQDAHASDGASHSPHSAPQCNPRLAEVLTPPSLSTNASAEAYAEEMTLTTGQALSSIPYNRGLQHHRLGVHYPNAVHSQYLQPAQPQVMPVRDDTHQHVSSLHVEHTATPCPVQTLASPATSQQSSPQLVNVRTAPQPSTHSHQHKQEQHISRPTAPLYATPADAQCHSSRPTAPLYATPADAQCHSSLRSAQRPSLPNRLTEPPKTTKNALVNTRFKVPEVPNKKIASTHMLGAPAVAERDNSTKDSHAETPPTAFFESTPSDWGTPPCVDSMDDWTVQDPWDLLPKLRQSECTTERGTVWDDYVRGESTDTLGQSGMSSSTLTKRAVDELSTVTGLTCLPASARDACSARARRYPSETQDPVEFLPTHHLADKVLTDDQHAIANSRVDTSGPEHVPWRPQDAHTRRLSEGNSPRADRPSTALPCPTTCRSTQTSLRACNNHMLPHMHSSHV